MPRYLLVPILLAYRLALSAENTVVELDPARTDIQFTVGDVLHKVHGSFKLKRGSIRFDPATGSAGGEIVVDVVSGDSGSASRDRRMHKDILQSDRYPEAVFAPDKMEGQLSLPGESQVDIHGQFTIHGTAHEVTLHAKVVAEGNDVTAEARFIVPYVKWGMRNPSTLILRVSDRVEIEMRISGHTRPL